MPQYGLPLPDPVRRRIAALVARDGERLTVARLGIARQTLARALGALPIQAGTAALIRQRLDLIGGDS